MWGSTGCGKTFLMDLFYDVIPIEKKKRIHFNNFMLNVHKKLFQLKSKKIESKSGKSK
jgi:protein AFG1